MKLLIFKSSIIEITLKDPEINRLPGILLCLIISGFKGVWLRNILSAENNL